MLVGVCTGFQGATASLESDSKNPKRVEKYNPDRRALIERLEGSAGVAVEHLIAVLMDQDSLDVVRRFGQREALDKAI